MVTPAVHTKFGLKGMGEGGAIGNALRDAFATTGAAW